MASRDVEIRLVAKDGTTQVFRQVSESAKRMGRDLDEAGKTSARSMKQAKDAGKDLAIGVGAVAGALAMAARAAAEEEATFRRLEAAVTATGAGYDQYAKQIDVAVSAGERLSFADDQTADALARMVGITGDVGASLNAMGVAMDFARLRNIDLSTSADLIGKALAGNTTALSRYGVVIAEGATTTEILAAIQAKAAGQAEAYADTTQGGIDRVKNAIDNQIESLGAWTGGIGQALATGAEFTFQLALMGGGLVKLGSGLKTLSGAAGLAGLAGALGPIGLAGAAIAAGAAFLILRDDASALEKQLALAEEASTSLRTEIDQLAAAGDAFALTADALGIKMETFGVGVKAAAASDIPALTNALDLAQDALSELEFTRKELLAGSRLGYFDTTQIIDLDRRIVEQTALVNLLSAELTKAEGSVGQFADAELALAAIFDHSGVGADRARANAVALFKAYDEGRITGDQLRGGLIELGNSLAEFDRQSIAATGSTDNLARSAETAASSQSDLNTAITESNSILGDFIDSVRGAGAAIGESARTQGTGDKIAAWLGLPTDWRSRLKDMQVERQQAAAPPLVSGAKDVTAAIIPAPIMATPDPMAISFFTDLEIAYANVGRGALMASEALLVFKGTQDGLLGSQDQYNHQLGEYNSQISAIDAALVLIQEKQAAGIALSAQEQGILDGSTAALERLTGGTNDATLARAELAIQYAENMRVGDQLNENMKGQQEITGALIGIVRDLILALDGVPEDVKTDIRAIDNATPTIRTVRGELDALDGKVSTTYIDTVRRNIGFTDQLYTGGTIGTIHAGSRGAAGGITVGEFGREFIPNPPHGMQVMPHGASMSRLESERKRGRRDGGMIFRGPVTFQVDTPDNYSVWRQQAIGGTRA